MVSKSTCKMANYLLDNERISHTMFGAIPLSLKYSVTCPGTSAKTHLAKAWGGAWKEKREGIISHL